MHVEEFFKTVHQNNSVQLSKNICSITIIKYFKECHYTLYFSEFIIHKFFV
jgi:hypothetical protein